MSQDLDQIILFIGAVLGVGFVLPFLMAWLEPVKPAASVQPLATRPRARLVLARRIVGPGALPVIDEADVAA